MVRHTAAMEGITVLWLLSIGGFAVTLVLMVWVLIDLARLRRHPDFSSPIAGSLRLHLMALGMSSAKSMDAPTRQRISGVRRRVLLAVVAFAGAAIAVLLQTP